MKNSKPLHIIIDGADGLGKTTVIQKLGRVLQLPTIKMPNMKEYVEKNSPEEFSKLFNETIVQFSEFDFILDRGFTSSRVYSRVFLRPFDLSYLTSIENILNPVVFIMTGRSPAEPGKVVGEYNYFRNDELFKHEDVELVDREFVKLAEKNGYNLIEVWGRSPDEIVRDIAAKVHER